MLCVLLFLLGEALDKRCERADLSLSSTDVSTELAQVLADLFAFKRHLLGNALNRSQDSRESPEDDRYESTEEYRAYGCYDEEHIHLQEVVHSTQYTVLLA